MAQTHRTNSSHRCELRTQLRSPTATKMQPPCNHHATTFKYSRDPFTFTSQHMAGMIAGKTSCADVAAGVQATELVFFFGPTAHRVGVTK